MFVYESAALAAAAFWALTGLISAGPSQYLGAIAFNQARMVMVFVGLSLYVALTSGWSSITPELALPILLSGFIGIFLGDTALFLTLNRLGPRRTAILFSMNAPISTLLGWLILGEILSARATLGIAITLTGVVLAITFGKRKSQLHHWESIKGPLWVGVSLGLGAALFQSVGSLFARPVMEAGADPVAVSSLRVGVAALGLVVLARLPVQRFQAGEQNDAENRRIDRPIRFHRHGRRHDVAAFRAIGRRGRHCRHPFGHHACAAIAVLWWRTKEVPALGAWIGAALVVAGSALIFMG